MSRRNAVWQDGNIGPEIGEFIGAQSNALNYQRGRDKMEMKAFKAKTESDDSAKAISAIKDLDHIGNSAVDITTDNALNSVREVALDMAAKKLPLNQILSYIQQSVPPIANGHTVAKNYSDQFRKQSIETAKMFGGDPEKLYQELMRSAVPDWIDADQGGNLSYKKMLDPNKNYIEPLMKEDGIPRWHSGSGKFDEAIATAKLEKTGETDKFDNKGNIIQTGYKGDFSSFVRPTKDDKGRVTGKEVVYEEVPFEGSKAPIRILPQKEQESLMSNPEVYADFTVRWAKEKAQTEQELGHKLQPKAAELLKGNLMYEMVKEKDISSYVPNDYQKIAKPPVTKITVNNNNGQPVAVRPMYTGIRQKVENPETEAITIGQRYLGKTMNALESDERAAVIAEYEKATGEDNVSADQLFLRVDGDNLRVYKFDDAHPKPSKETTVEQAKKYQLPETFVTISKEGTDIKAQVNVKAKTEVVKNNQGGAPAPKSAYKEIKTINGVKWGMKADGTIEKVK